MTAALGEFELIERYFKRPAPASVMLGVGDDCALLQAPAGQVLAISSDMLVSGRHFFPDIDPHALGHKALAVNLSDLAAMGAQPLGFTLALALPEVDETWLAAFAAGLWTQADAFACPLIGGDTTRGPLNLSLTVFGSVPPALALRRSGAQAGDDLWVSGELGDARLALGYLLGEWSLDSAALARTRLRLERPTPRLALGTALRGIASAALDISDGLAGDLRHLLRASGLNATLQLAQLPCSATLRTQPLQRQWLCALAGGDDYELCFSAPPTQRQTLAQLAAQLALPLTRIGTLTAPQGTAGDIQYLDAQGQSVPPTWRGFTHF